MTSAELLTWLQWHHEHAPYIWGGIAATAVGVRALQQRWRREQQEPDAAWATMRQVREAKLDGQHGLVIGGYRGHMLRYHGEGHVIIVAPPRTGKTSSIVVPTLLEPHPQTSVLVNDPKGELYRMTQRYRRTISRVYRLDPTNLQSDHYNPFDAVRIGTPHEAGDLRLLARLLTNPDNKESKDATVQFWDDATAMAAQAFILCGLLTGQGMNPGSLYDLMSTRTIADLLTDLEGTLHPLCCQAAQTLREMTDGGQKSVIMGIRKSLQIYSDGLVARMTAHSDFRAEDLRAGPQPLTIYCTLPFGQDDVLNVMRVIFRQLLGGAMQTNPAPSTQRQSMHGWDYDVLVPEPSENGHHSPGHQLWRGFWRAVVPDYAKPQDTRPSLWPQQFPGEYGGPNLFQPDG